MIWLCKPLIIEIGGVVNGQLTEGARTMHEGEKGDMST